MRPRHVTAAKRGISSQTQPRIAAHHTGRSKRRNGGKRAAAQDGSSKRGSQNGAHPRRRCGQWRAAILAQRPWSTGGNPDDYAPAQDAGAPLFKGHVKRGTESGLMLYQDLAVANGANLPEFASICTYMTPSRRPGSRSSTCAR